MCKSLTGKVCLITGASSGIGKATARVLLEEGAKVLGVGYSSAHIEQARAELTSERFHLIQADVSDEASVRSAFKICEEHFGSVDILINNAGVGVPTPDLALAETATFDRMFAVNVGGVFLCTREALRRMKPRRRGHILTVVSMAAHRVNAVAPLYCASKAAARAFCLGLAEQVLKEGIRVTVVNPGAVDSNYWGDRAVPREKMLKAEEVARLICFVLTLPEQVVLHEINFDSMRWYAP